jgi:hypothetical protein
MVEKIFGRRLSMVSVENSINEIHHCCFIDKFSLITNEECVESNVIPVEAMKFLEEETPMESINNGPNTNDQDGEEEDLVCQKKNSEIFLLNFRFILVRSNLNQQIHDIHKHTRKTQMKSIFCR